jgi:hypothetical protein
MPGAVKFNNPTQESDHLMKQHFIWGVIFFFKDSVTTSTEESVLKSNHNNKICYPQMVEAFWNIRLSCQNKII